MKFTEQIQEWTWAIEGGYVDDPADPGGATNLGITRKTLARWRGVSPYTALPKSEVKALGKAEAARIYKAGYWDVVKGDQMPAGLDYALFDYAINSGPARAIKDLQRILKVGVDGVIGIETTDAVMRMTRAQVEAAIISLCEMRFAFVRSLSTFARFGKGWTRRIMGGQLGAQPGDDVGVIDRAVLLHRDGAQNVPPASTPAPGKAQPEPVSIDDLVKKPEVWAPASAGASGILAAISGNQAISIALALVIVGAAALAAYSFIRRMQKVDTA